jgi:hypothetical protein
MPTPGSQHRTRALDSQQQLYLSFGLGNPKFVEETTADPSTPFAAKNAANYAQDDNSFTRVQTKIVASFASTSSMIAGGTDSRRRALRALRSMVRG